MGLLYLDSTGEYSEPIKTTLLYLDATHNWSRPAGGGLLDISTLMAHGPSR